MIPDETGPASSAFGFELPSEVTELANSVGSFVREQIVPFETDPRWGAHGPSEELRLELNALARRAGVFAPQVAREYGGHALSHVAQSAVFTAAGYSMLGPVAVHCAAPDEGNINLLSHIATPEQRERFLRPLATGAVRSCFCMTEPSPGAGSDPGQLATTARRDGDSWVIDGRKWLITGADGAGFAIIMAKIVGGEADGRASMFLADMREPGIVLERSLEGLASSFTGGHAVVRFEGLRVRDDAVLGVPGEGFRYAQVRLAPARLTHCMRWLGSAIRAQEIATQYAARRTAFGRPIGGHEGVSFMLADNAMDIHVAQLVIWHTAWLLDRGSHAASESSMAKVICSEAVYRVADRCLQILGGLGTTRDTVVERIFRDVRSFRIYDGPSEVHRWALGRRALKAQ